MGDKRKHLPGWGLGLAALALATGAIAADGAADPYDGRWHFQVAPYLWLPNVNGSSDLTVGGLRGADGRYLETLDLSAKLGPNDYLENLQAALMLMGEARKGNWSVYTDIIYVDMGNQKTRVRPRAGPRGVFSTEIERETETDMQSTVWTLGGGYTVARGTYGTLDLIAGLRYLGLDSSLTLDVRDSSGRLDRAGKVSMDQEEWDGIVGVRGQILLADPRWFLPYYADIGTGSSNWTWQALLGLGYRFDWGDLTLSLRSLSYEFDENDTDIRFTGPALGVGFRW